MRTAALGYLRGIGLDPADAVSLVVATHWHDDHIRGISELVEVCDKAVFSCAAALCTEEFLSVLGALEGRPATASGSGLRELHRVFSLLSKRSAPCRFAVPDRRIFSRNECEIWSLSPSDRAYQTFLQQIGQLVPREYEAKRRISPLTRNNAAVVVLVCIGDVAILLGADLDRRGWLAVLEDYDEAKRKASVFKVPHHGSSNAHEERMWNEMVGANPIVAVTPWRRGGAELPTPQDGRRILRFSSRAYVTAKKAGVVGSLRDHSDSAVNKTLREAGASIRTLSTVSGMIRMRKRIGVIDDWCVETLGVSCTLQEYIQTFK